MPEEEKKEELIPEPLKTEEPIPHPLIEPVEKVRTSNLEDDSNILAQWGSYGVSDHLRNSNNEEKSNGGTTYIKLKETKLEANLDACRIVFGLYSSTGTSSAFGRIYKNGTAIGTERSTTDVNWVYFTEDFTGFKVGDLIQIYGKASAGVAYVANFRFYYDSKLTKLGGANLYTTILGDKNVPIAMINQDP